MVCYIHICFPYYCFLFLFTDGELPGCSVKDLLIFFTGMDTIPPFGFETTPSITFNHDPTVKFPKASTCQMELRLPLVHGSQYNHFRDHMVLGIMSNDGFGLG